MFRTTVVPGLLGREDIRKIGVWLEGAEIYQLQQFVPHDTIDPAWLDVKPYPREEFVMLAGDRPAVLQGSPRRRRLINMVTQCQFPNDEFRLDFSQDK